jgi:hypothetical protein
LKGLEILTITGRLFDDEGEDKRKAQESACMWFREVLAGREVEVIAEEFRRS